MSKTIEAVGLIVGGIGLALLSGPVGIIALQGSMGAFHAMLGLGLTSALAGVGLALRQTPPTVSTANSIGFANGVSPRRVIYGQFQTAGVLTYASFPPSQNQATTSQFLHLIYTLCGHEISSFDAVVIDGYIYNFGSDILEDSSLPNTPWQVHPYANPTANDFYWEHIFFEFDSGNADNNTNQPFPNLAASDPAWTSACLQQGCAKVHVILRADSGWTALYPSGQMPNIQFLVTGKKLIDPRISTIWIASTAFAQYTYIVSFGEPVGGLLPGPAIWVQMNSGSPTTGSSRPNFEDVHNTIGTIITDGGCSWRCVGRESDSFDGAKLPPTLAGARLLCDAWGPSLLANIYSVIEAPLGYFQMATVSGTTGTTRPTFSTTLGGTTSDNGITWTCMGRSPHAINPSNPALVVSDYLQDTDAGMGAALSTIDLSSVIAAANVCEVNEQIIVNADLTNVKEHQYSCNGMFDHSSTRGNVLSALLASMAGWAIPPGDEWHVFAGAYNAPVLSYTDNDLRGPIKADFRLSRRDVANSIKGTYNPAYLPASPAAAISLTSVPGTWQSQTFPPYQANGAAGKPDYIGLEDGGQVIWQDVHFDFTTSLWMAQRLAKITMMRLRFQTTLTLQFKLTAFQLEAGDTFNFTHRWGTAVYEAMQVALVLDTSGKDGPVLGVDVVARLTDPSIYSFTVPTSSTNYGEYSPYGVTGVMTGVE